jgi:hypothetical protein
MDPLIEPLTQAPATSWLAAVAAGAAGLTLGVQRVLRLMTADKAATVEDKARVDIVEGLRSELKRCRERIDELEDLVKAMRSEIEQLRAAR